MLKQFQNPLDSLDLRTACSRNAYPSICFLNNPFSSGLASNFAIVQAAAKIRANCHIESLANGAIAGHYPINQPIRKHP